MRWANLKGAIWNRVKLKKKIKRDKLSNSTLILMKNLSRHRILKTCWNRWKIGRRKLKNLLKTIWIRSGSQLNSMSKLSSTRRLTSISSSGSKTSQDCSSLSVLYSAKVTQRIQSHDKISNQISQTLDQLQNKIWLSSFGKHLLSQPERTKSFLSRKSTWAFYTTVDFEIRATR